MTASDVSDSIYIAFFSGFKLNLVTFEGLTSSFIGSISFVLPKSAKPSGKIRFETKIFDDSGRAVSSFSSADYFSSDRLVGMRRGEMISMENHASRQLLQFYIPTRCIIGLRTKVMNVTSGEAIMSHLFDHYGPVKGEIPQRTNGVMISMAGGKSILYAIENLQGRGIFFVAPGEECYEGMIVGEHCKEGDIDVNVQKAKKLSNMRAAGSDHYVHVAPPLRMSLEEALEYIGDDEYVEVTPKNIRLRKKYLSELERKKVRYAKAAAKAEEEGKGN